MTDTPKDGDIGRAGSHSYLRFSNGKWTYPSGGGTSYDITPTGECAVPTEWRDDVKAVAAEMREAIAEWGDYGPPNEADIRQWADRIDPPTPEPEPRWRENTIVNYGDNEFLYIVNADGVPCSRNGAPTGYPLDSERWRVLGTFTPLPEGDGGTNRLQDAAEIVGRAVAAKHRLEADWKAATAVADGDGQ